MSASAFTETSSSFPTVVGSNGDRPDLGRSNEPPLAVTVTGLRGWSIALGLLACMAVGLYLWVVTAQEGRSLLIAAVAILFVSAYVTWLIARTIREVTDYAAAALRHLINWLAELFPPRRRVERWMAERVEVERRQTALLEQVLTRLGELSTRVETLTTRGRVPDMDSEVDDRYLAGYTDGLAKRALDEGTVVPLPTRSR